VNISIDTKLEFFVFGSYIAFALAAKKTNNDTDYWSERLRGMSHLWSDRLPTNDEMRRTQYFELGKVSWYVRDNIGAINPQKKLQGKLAKLKEVTAEMPSILRDLIVFSYVDAAQRYLDTTDARRVCWKICAINGFIWLAWKLPRLRNFMAVNFMHHPRSGLSYTLLTSMFRYVLFPIISPTNILSCMALNSFGNHFLVFPLT
jgi:rhomboid-like protein